MKRILRFLLALLFAMACIVVVRTRQFASWPAAAVQPAPGFSMDSGAAERLAGALRIATVSWDDSTATDSSTFRTLHAYLQAHFPRVHTTLQHEIVGGNSLLYCWPGINASLRPILFCAHLDVVPVDSETFGDWREAPFDGAITEGIIWGRGALDDKCAVLGSLEAVETVLAEGFVPARTLYLAFGHDEELGGTRGARAIAALLKSRGVHLDMVLDEGGLIAEGLLPGVSKPVALVGVAEKGFVTFELTVTTDDGHSSMPPPQTAVGILSAALARLENHPMPARLEGPALRLFEKLGPHFPWEQQAVFANLWLTKPLVIRKLEDSPGTNAMVRTTMAVTRIRGGTKDNVLPAQARATVNCRIAPWDNVLGAREYVRSVIGDPRVDVEIAKGLSAEPSAESNVDSDAYRLLERTILSIAPDVVVAPYLVVVATDARHYSELCRNIYRFLPIRLYPEDLGRIHGTNERISADQYEQVIRLYRELLLNSAG